MYDAVQLYYLELEKQGECAILPGEEILVVNPRVQYPLFFPTLYIKIVEFSKKSSKKIT